MFLSAKQRNKIYPFAVLIVLMAVAVIALFLINDYLFPSEVTTKFEDNDKFIEWYKKALEAYQSGASLFSAWAASCIIAGYALVKDLTKTDKYFKTALGAFVILVVLSIFDLYLSQAYFSYNTYVFNYDYPIFMDNTILRHIKWQKYTHLLMFINLFFLAGISLIRKYT